MMTVCPFDFRAWIEEEGFGEEDEAVAEGDDEDDGPPPAPAAPVLEGK